MENQLTNGAQAAFQAARGRRGLHRSTDSVHV